MVFFCFDAFLPFQSEAARMYLVCLLSVSPSSASWLSSLGWAGFALSHYLCALSLGFWASFIRGKTVCFDDLPQLLMLPGRVEWARWQSRDQKAQSGVCSSSYVYMCLHFFPSVAQMFSSPGCCGFTVLSLWLSAANKGVVWSYCLVARQVGKILDWNKCVNCNQFPS